MEIGKMKHKIGGYILALVILVLMVLLVSGCDVMPCHPQFNLEDEYIGFVCKGDW